MSIPRERLTNKVIAGWEDGYHSGPLKDGYPPTFFDENDELQFPWQKDLQSPDSGEENLDETGFSMQEKAGRFMSRASSRIAAPDVTNWDEFKGLSPDEKKGLINQGREQPSKESFIRYAIRLEKSGHFVGWNQTWLDYMEGDEPVSQDLSRELSSFADSLDQRGLKPSDVNSHLGEQQAGRFMSRASSRIAAPDDESGRNYNTPIRIYDTKPNARFAIGEEVIPLDPNDAPVRGLVIGHVAEDRLLVQWPHEVTQVDTDDVIAMREWKLSIISSDETSSRKSSRERDSSRDFTRVALFGWGNPQKKIEKQYGGAYQALGQFNAFRQPQVVKILQSYGMAPREVENYAGLRDRQIQKLQEKRKMQNEQFAQTGDLQHLQSGPQWGEGLGTEWTKSPSKPAQPRMPKPAVQQSQSSPTDIYNIAGQPNQGTPDIYNVAGSKLATQGMKQLEKAANLTHGILNDVNASKAIRLLAQSAQLSHLKDEGTPSVVKATSRLAIKIADTLRNKKIASACSIADMVEDGVVNLMTMKRTA